MDLDALYQTINSYVIVGATLCVLCEAVFSLRRKDGVLTLGDFSANLITSLMYQIIRKLLFVGLFATTLGICAKLSPWQLESSSVWVWVLSFFVIDFLYYWDHRFGH